MNRDIWRRRASVCLVLLLCLTLTSAASAAAEKSKYLRFVPDGHGGGALEASTVRFVHPKTGAVVDLVAAVHVADAAYFHALNRQFRGYDAVLYEMVKPKDAAAPRPGQRSGHWIGQLQQFMTLGLELHYQLDLIDYVAPNFVHADLDAETFVELQAERGESFATLMLRSMLNEMFRDPATRAPQPDLLALASALQSPDRSRQLKLVLAGQFQEMDRMIESMEGPDGSVLLTERNKAALAVLKRELAAGKKSLAIFYGAGHLKGMEAILTGEMGFVAQGEPKWLSAWDLRVDLDLATTRPTTTRGAASGGVVE